MEHSSTTLKPWETVVCWYLQGNHSGLLTCCEMDFDTIHSISSRLPKAIKRLVEVARLFVAERQFFAPGPEYQCVYADHCAYNSEDASSLRPARNPRTPQAGPKGMLDASAVGAKGSSDFERQSSVNTSPPAFLDFKLFGKTRLVVKTNGQTFFWPIHSGSETRLQGE